jgi:hypothetical protein
MFVERSVAASGVIVTVGPFRPADSLMPKSAALMAGVSRLTLRNVKS